MKINALLTALVLAAFMVGCVAQNEKKTYHDEPLPDPASYNTNFKNMETSGNDLVDWDEFKSHFDHAELKVFQTIDLDKDNMLSYYEWHRFQKAHRLPHTH